MIIDKRLFMKGALALAAAAGGLAGTGVAAFAQTAPARELSDMEKKLMEPGPLPDKTLGDLNAPITVIEYASMTCGHCAHFSETAFPILKSEYIDKGKVLYMLREFPLDPLAAAAFMIARNAPGDQYYLIIETMFARQKDWAFVDDPVTGLRNLAKQFGYSPATFDATLKDQKLLDAISAIRARAADEFKVNSTPTFFINGEEVKGAMEPDDMKLRLDTILANLPK